MAETKDGDRDALQARKAALPIMDRPARLDRVRLAMEGTCDGLIVTKPVNVRWLTGFTGSNATVIVTPSTLTIITDGRYATQVGQQLDAAGLDADVVIERIIDGPVRDALATSQTVGLEAGHVTWGQQRQFADWLDEATLVPTERLVEEERFVKDDGEIERLRTAAAIADAALAAVAPTLGAGRSEQDVARDLEQTMYGLGADGLSFATIVASGPNSAKPHATPSERIIVSGDLVVIDFGASVDGYGSDMTRTFLVGDASDRQRELFGAVEAAQAAGVAAVRAGVEERVVDAACRDQLAERGLADAFVHGTGHGIGLEIHENPFLSTRSTGILRSGSVVTVEPGAYLPDLGGVRIEDSVVVTESGCEPITHSPKDPAVPAG